MRLSGDRCYSSVTLRYEDKRTHLCADLVLKEVEESLIPWADAAVILGQ